MKNKNGNTPEYLKKLGEYLTSEESKIASAKNNRFKVEAKNNRFILGNNGGFDIKLPDIQGKIEL